MNIKKVTAVIGLALVGLSNLQASITFVSTRDGLSPNDSVDWGQLGGSYTTISSPSTVVSANGLVMTVASSGGDMERLDQGFGWNGNFAPGDKLLWNRGNSADISITFPTSIYGLGGGAQLQDNYFGIFSGTISVYDDADNLLSSAFIVGNSTPAGDNSAVFAGILSTAPDIHKITFSGLGDFAINQLALATTPIPEASSFVAGALLLLPFSARALRMLRRHRKA